MSLARKFKIGNKGRIESLLKKGTRLRGHFFEWRYLPRSKFIALESTTRFSLVTSKRIGRKAVSRNKIRRRIYEAIRICWPYLPGPCYDIVVLPFPRTRDASFSEIQRDIQKCMKKLHSLRNLSL